MDADYNLWLFKINFNIKNHKDLKDLSVINGTKYK